MYLNPIHIVDHLHHQFTIFRGEQNGGNRTHRNHLQPECVQVPDILPEQLVGIDTPERLQPIGLSDRLFN